MRNLGGNAIMINHNLVPYILKEYIGRGFFIEKNRRVNKMYILEDLQKRGLIQQITNEEGLQKHLVEKEVKLYCGFEPTGDSLHIGHLLPVLILKRFQFADNNPIVLIGGYIVIIGGPSVHLIQRSLNTVEDLISYADFLTKQLSQLLKFDISSKSVVARTNNVWLP